MATKSGNLSLIEAIKQAWQTFLQRLASGTLFSHSYAGELKELIDEIGEQIDELEELTKLSNSENAIQQAHIHATSTGIANMVNYITKMADEKVLDNLKDDSKKAEKQLDILREGIKKSCNLFMTGGVEVLIDGKTKEDFAKSKCHVTDKGVFFEFENGDVRQVYRKFLNNVDNFVFASGRLSEIPKDAVKVDVVRNVLVENFDRPEEIRDIALSKEIATVLAVKVEEKVKLQRSVIALAEKISNLNEGEGIANITEKQDMEISIKADELYMQGKEGYYVFKQDKLDRTKLTLYYNKVAIANFSQKNGMEIIEKAIDIPEICSKELDNEYVYAYLLAKQNMSIDDSQRFTAEISDKKLKYIMPRCDDRGHVRYVAGKMAKIKSVKGVKLMAGGDSDRLDFSIGKKSYSLSFKKDGRLNNLYYNKKKFAKGVTSEIIKDIPPEIKGFYEHYSKLTAEENRREVANRNKKNENEKDKEKGKEGEKSL